MNVIICILIAMVATWVSIHYASRVALRIDLVDIPGGRKKHAHPVPLVGGISVFFGFVLSTSFLSDSLNDLRSFFIASGLLIFTGVLDDFKELEAKPRLLMQVFVALLLTLWGGNVITSFGNIFGFGEISMPYWVGLCFSVFAIIAMINAFNMLDGLDGLSSSVGLSQVFSCSVIAFCAGLTRDFSLLIIFMSCLLVFLYFNFPWVKKSHAKVFMGDAGSMFLGCALAWFSLWIPKFSNYDVHPVLMLWVLFLPIVDTIQVVVYRILKGNSPMEADREHLHHLLLSVGFHKRHVTIFMFIISLFMGSMGILGYVCDISQPLMFYSFVFFVAAYLVATFYLRKVRGISE